MNRGAGFGISAGICLVIFNKDTSKAANFNPLSRRQGVCHSIEEDVHNFFSLVAGESVLIFYCVDKVRLVHNDLLNIN